MIKKDEESLELFKEVFKKHIGNNTSFNKFMKKMKITVNTVLKMKKKVKLGRKVKKTILAAEWVDQELIENITLRNRLSKKLEK